MKKSLVLRFIAILLFSVVLILAAKPDFQIAKITNPVTGELKNTVALPLKAVEVALNIIYLGEALDEGTGKIVYGYAFID